MKSIIEKLVLSEEITPKDIQDELYEICDRVHASCDTECPVYRLNGNSAVGQDKPFSENRGCDCFKSGAAMANFILTHT